MTIISKEPTNFTGAYPNVFSNLTSDHDLTYRAYKVCEDDNETIHQEPKLCRYYNRMDMEQLESDIYAQN
jgi:hypothetical protein